MQWTTWDDTTDAILVASSARPVAAASQKASAYCLAVKASGMGKQSYVVAEGGRAVCAAGADADVGTVSAQVSWLGVTSTLSTWAAWRECTTPICRFAVGPNQRSPNHEQLADRMASSRPRQRQRDGHRRGKASVRFRDTVDGTNRAGRRPSQSGPSQSQALDLQLLAVPVGLWLSPAAAAVTCAKAVTT